MTDPDEIKAGQYELVSEVWDEPKSKLGEPYDFTRHVKGDIVTLNVEEARRLYTSGAVVRKGEREKAAAQFALQQAQLALAALPPEVREELEAQADPGTAEQVESLEKQLAEAKAAQTKAEAEAAAAKKALAAAQK